jgi:hypothetical protein
MVRVLKNWRLSVPVEAQIKSLVMEILALECMPRDGSRPHALRAFFTAAAVRVNRPLVDPAGHCGEIQPDLDTVALRSALAEAAETAAAACAAADGGDTDGALRAWQRIFGPAFPVPEATIKKDRWGAGPALITPRRVKDTPQG